MVVIGFVLTRAPESDSVIIISIKQMRISLDTTIGKYKAVTTSTVLKCNTFSRVLRIAKLY